MGYKTYQARQHDVEAHWWLIDADGQTLGRLATRVATVLRGKYRPNWSPHLDLGDYVVVVNAERVAVSGKKLEEKRYYRHSGYPGGMRERVLGDVLREHPERVIRTAVKGMLPRNRMRHRMLGKLKIYAGPTHPHQAQRPDVLDAASATMEVEA